MLNPATQSLRLPGYDYSSGGGYFITAKFSCSSSDHHLISDTIRASIECFANRNPVFRPDEWVAMSDHFHLIFLLLPELGIQTPLVVGECVRAIKARASHDLHKLGLSDFCWQSNYYDRIIRNERELDKLRNYIRNNPLARELKGNGDFSA